MPTRIAPLIASRGLASRRGAEAMITEGRVVYAGEVVTELGFHVEDPALVRVDGRPLPPEPPKVYYLLYKPRGYVTTRDDPKGRKTIEDFLDPLPVRVEAVGRLDYDTEGALLLTNDGDLANRLLHPSHDVPKRYRVKVYRTPGPKKLEQIRKGRVFLEDGATRPAMVRVVDGTDQHNAWVEVTVTEGRNRLIRRMFAALGHPVSKLRRESFATLSLRGLERGQLRTLTRNEVNRLREIADGVPARKAGHKKGKGFAKAKPRPRRGHVRAKPKDRRGKSKKRRGRK